MADNIERKDCKWPGEGARSHANFWLAIFCTCLSCSLVWWKSLDRDQGLDSCCSNHRSPAQKRGGKDKMCVCVCSLVHRLSNLFNIGNWGVWEYYGIEKIIWVCAVYADVPLEVQKTGRGLDSWPRGKIHVHQSTSANLVWRNKISIIKFTCLL